MYLKLMRIKHWLKNLLIFLPIVCSGKLFDFYILYRNIVAFFSFSLLASGVYIINDICDIDNDRKHIKKRNRPIASGKISIINAKVFCVVLITVSLFLCLYLAIGKDKLNYIVILYYLLYFFLNVLYSVYGFKNRTLLDITLLMLFYILRVMYGSSVSDINISIWLYLVILSGSFYLGFGKRRGELLYTDNSGHREVLEKYSLEYLDKCMNICMSMSIVFYALWCKEHISDIEIYNPYFLSIPVLILIFFRYSFILDTKKEQYGDPIDTLLADNITLVLVILFMSIFISMIYLY